MIPWELPAEDPAARLRAMLERERPHVERHRRALARITQRLRNPGSPVRILNPKRPHDD